MEATQPQIPPDSPLAALLHRLELSGPAAADASHELWPNHLMGSCNAMIYLQWHEKVRPGGSLHPLNEDGVDLNVRGPSTEEVSRALISMMDHLHLFGANWDQASQAVVELPAGLSCDMITSLSAFFKRVRFYVV